MNKLIANIPSHCNVHIRNKYISLGGSQLTETLLEFDECRIEKVIIVMKMLDYIGLYFSVSYYREHIKEVTANCINFEILFSNYEEKISYDSLSLKHKYHKKQIVLAFPNELRRKRGNNGGIYVIEFISSGIGNIEFIERLSSNSL